MSYHLLCYRLGDQVRLGIETAGAVYDLAELLRDERYASFAVVLDNWPACSIRLAAASGQIAQGEHQGAARPGVTLAAPYLAGQIYAGGGNYTDHLEAVMRMIGGDKPADPRANGGEPWFFVKPGRASVVGQGAEIPHPRFTKMLDYELECGFR